MPLSPMYAFISFCCTRLIFVCSQFTSHFSTDGVLTSLLRHALYHLNFIYLSISPFGAFYSPRSGKLEGEHLQPSSGERYFIIAPRSTINENQEKRENNTGQGLLENKREAQKNTLHVVQLY